MTAREEYCWLMGKEGVPLDVTRSVMRWASTLKRLAGAACTRGLTPHEERKIDSLRRRVTAALAPYGVSPVFSGDPRGAVVVAQVPSGTTNDWGRVGICVP